MIFFCSLSLFLVAFLIVVCSFRFEHEDCLPFWILSFSKSIFRSAVFPFLSLGQFLFAHLPVSSLKKLPSTLPRTSSSKIDFLHIPSHTSTQTTLNCPSNSPLPSPTHLKRTTSLSPVSGNSSSQLSETSLTHSVLRSFQSSTASLS